MQPRTVVDMIRSIVCLSLPAFALTIGLVEVFLRATGYVPYYLDRDAFVPAPNPGVVYRLRPGWTGLYAGVPVRINSMGMRGGELDDFASAGLRVVILGDSIAFGQGVLEPKTLSEQLKAYLSPLVPQHLGVVNLGIPGHNTCQEYARFQDDVVPLKPHAVVLVYFENDVEPPPFHIIDNVVFSPDIRPGPFGDIMAAVRKHSMAYNFAWSRWNAIKAQRAVSPDYAQAVNVKFDDSSPGWQESRQCLADMIHSAAAQDIRLLVVPFPVLSGLAERPYPFARYVEAVCAAVRNASGECVDVVPMLADPGLRLNVSVVERHPAPEVYRAIGVGLAAKLADRRTLATRPGND